MALRRSLPFEHQRDFEAAQHGFLAAADYKQIMAEAGYGAWAMGSYAFRLRGFDLANMTISKGQTGWILFDVLTCKGPQGGRSMLSISSSARGRLWRSCIATVMPITSALSLVLCQKKMQRVARCRFLALLSSWSPRSQRMSRLVLP